MKGQGRARELHRLACLMCAGALAASFATAEPTRTYPLDPQQRMPSAQIPRTQQPVQPRQQTQPTPQSGQGTERLASAGAVPYLSHPDRRFITQALENGIAKVRELQLAERHAASPAVRKAAEQLLTEQMRANAELQRLAANHGVVAPREATEDRRGQLSKLRSLTGANFDKELLRSQLSAHNRVLQLYQRAQLESNNRTVKMFVANNLPRIRESIIMLTAAQAKGNAAALQSGASSRSATTEPVSPLVDSAVTDAAVEDAAVDASVTPLQPQ